MHGLWSAPGKRRRSRLPHETSRSKRSSRGLSEAQVGTFEDIETPEEMRSAPPSFERLRECRPSRAHAFSPVRPYAELWEPRHQPHGQSLLRRSDWRPRAGGRTRCRQPDHPCAGAGCRASDLPSHRAGHRLLERHRYRGARRRWRARCVRASSSTSRPTTRPSSGMHQTTLEMLWQQFLDA